MDPVAGRFVSEDPACDGSNWYMYASDCPSDRVDSSGTTSTYVSGIALGLGLLFALLAYQCVVAAGPAANLNWLTVSGGAGAQLLRAQGFATMAVACFALAAWQSNDVMPVGHDVLTAIGIGLGLIQGTLTLMLASASAGSQAFGLASAAVGAAFTYGLVLAGTIVSTDVAFMTGS